jgi:type VII secretion integral membrane protein EccD
VPRSVTWPEPDYDDVVEEIAEQARRRGRAWDATATRLMALAAAGLVLLAGLVALSTLGPPWTVPAGLATAVAVLLLGAGTLIARAAGDAVIGATAGGFALPYAAVGAGLALGGDTPLVDLGPAHGLVASVGLLFAAVLGGAGIGHGLRIFAAGVTVGVFGAAGALLGLALSPVRAAAVLIVALVAGIGLAPVIAVRLGRLPLPIVSSALDAVAAPPPDRPRVLAAVIRADELLAGSLLGIGVLAVAGLGVLSTDDGLAAGLLVGLAAVALLLRARLFPGVGARLPLLVAGVVGLGIVALSAVLRGGTGVRLVAVGVAFVAVAALLVTAAVAYRRRSASPYLGRLADILDVLAVVSLAPVAAAVLDLYTYVRGLAG